MRVWDIDGHEAFPQNQLMRLVKIEQRGHSDQERDGGAIDEIDLSAFARKCRPVAGLASLGTRSLAARVRYYSGEFQRDNFDLVLLQRRREFKWDDSHHRCHWDI
jgi:hypothetical protein